MIFVGMPGVSAMAVQKALVRDIVTDHPDRSDAGYDVGKRSERIAASKVEPVQIDVMDKHG